MRKLWLLFSVVMMVGCSTTANIQKINGAAEPGPAHDRAVCLLDTPLPKGTAAEYMGRGVSNSQWYGGYAGVRKLLANRAREGGVDVVADMQYRQVIGFFALVRPRVYGDAYSLAHPESFDCIALGGTLYGSNGPLIASFNPTRNSTTPANYDDCMARVLKIQDSALRLESMKMCDGAAK